MLDANLQAQVRAYFDKIQQPIELIDGVEETLQRLAEVHDLTLMTKGQGGAAGRSIVELVIHEGRNRIVRRLLDHVGHPVRTLSRTAIGPVRLGNLRSGAVRDLTSDELGALLDSVGL